MTHIVIFACVFAFVLFVEFRLKKEVLILHKEIFNLMNTDKNLSQKIEICNSRIDNILINGEHMQ